MTTTTTHPLAKLAAKPDVAPVRAAARKLAHPEVTDFDTAWNALREAVETQERFSDGDISWTSVVDPDEVTSDEDGWSLAESYVESATTDAIFTLVNQPGSRTCWACNRMVYGVPKPAVAGSINCATHQAA